MNKKVLLRVSFAALLLFFLLQTNYLTHQLCTVASTCSTIFKTIKLLLLISLAVFPISLLAIFLRDDGNELWRKFTIAYTGLFALAVLVAPSSGADYIKIEKGTVAIGLTVLYALISLTLILYKHFSRRGK